MAAVASATTNVVWMRMFLLSLLEERQIDGVAHGGVAGVVRVEVIARVVLRQELGRRRGIARGLVHVHDAVVGAARADPFVERLPLRFTFRRVVGRALV